MADIPPPPSLETRKRNFRNVQIDAVGVGLASAAGPFLPVFLARLGATNFQVGLLTTMPGVAGLDVLREVKARRPRMKSIIITAYPSEETTAEAAKLGAGRPKEADDG